MGPLTGWDGTQPRKGDNNAGATADQPEASVEGSGPSGRSRVRLGSRSQAGRRAVRSRPQDRARVAGPREGCRRGRSRPAVPEAPTAPDPRRNGQSDRGGSARVRLGRLPYTPLAPSGPPDQGGRQDHRADLRGSRPAPRPGRQSAAAGAAATQAVREGDPGRVRPSRRQGGDRQWDEGLPVHGLRRLHPLPRPAPLPPAQHTNQCRLLCRAPPGAAVLDPAGANRSRHRVLLRLRAGRPARRSPPPVHQAAAPATEWESGTQPPHRQRRVLEPLLLRLLCRGRGRPPFVGDAVQHGAVLYGASGPDPDREARGGSRRRGLTVEAHPMLTDRGQLQGEGRRAPRTRVDDGGRYLSTPKPKASHRLHQRSTASLTARPSRVPFLTTKNSKRRRARRGAEMTADGDAQPRTGAAPASLMVSTHRAMVTTARCTEVAG